MITSLSKKILIVQNVADDKLDLGVADISITSERLNLIDFSPPIIESGIIIVAENKLENNDLFTFLSPFSIEIWLGIVFALFTVLLIQNVYLL